MHVRACVHVCVCVCVCVCACVILCLGCPSILSMFHHRKHSDVVVPVLVWRNDKEALRKLEDICVCSSQDLLRGCLPRCMLVVLTTYASQKEGLPVDAAKKDQASACHDLLSSEYFGEEVCVCVCLCVCMHVCVYAYACVCMCMHVCVYMCILVVVVSLY